MSTAPLFTLGEVVDQYCIRRFNDRRKYYDNYLSIAQDVYRELYRKILPSTISRAVEIIHEDNEPHPFAWVPDDMECFYSLNIPTKNGELAEVFYNEKINVFTPPKKKLKCGCVTNDLCDCISNLQLITTPKEIDGAPFIEKQWLQCCANGDVMEYREVPVKNYGTEGGSYNNDYGNDYDIIASDGNVVVLKFTKKLGKLDVKPCGCVEETPNNKKIIYECCGCYLGIKPVSCTDWLCKNKPCKSSIKFSECGTKIYLINVKAEYAVISYQHDGVKCGEEVMVREYERKALWSGINYESIVYFPKSTPNDIMLSRQIKLRDETELFEYLNPIDAERFFKATAELKL